MWRFAPLIAHAQAAWSPAPDAALEVGLNTNAMPPALRPEGFMIKDAIARVMRGENLETGEAAAVMHEIMTGEATPAQMGGLLVALRMKGETADEVVGFVRTMRERFSKTSRTSPLEMRSAYRCR